MRKLLYSLMVVAVSVFSSCNKSEPQSLAIIPKPLKMEQSSGHYTLKSGATIAYDSSSERLGEIASLASIMVKKYSAIELEHTSGKGDITLAIVENSSANPESYTLTVNGDGVLIEAPSEAGIFYGIQSLSQMIEPAGTSPVELSYVLIEDSPRLEWRGLHLDVGRHFFTKEEVMKFIDLMSVYKLNKFHWHLTEDQGWRIEIKKYPLLTEVGAWRKSVGFAENQELGYNTDDGSKYGGYYTQEEVKEVVEYARLRQVEVIPEIEIPGHSLASLTSYPHLYCFPNEKLEVWNRGGNGGVSDGVYCAGKETTFKFLEDVLDEVMVLFPSKYVHIGGDEAPKNNWKRCPNCQKRIKAEGLKDEYELQSYFISRIEKFVNSRGKEIIGWDEIMEGGLSPTATVMAWRGITPGIEAAELGNKVIMTPGTPCYVSFPQSYNTVTKHPEGLPVHSLYDVYSYDPIPKELDAKYHNNIIGVQACQWTENTPTYELVMYKNYPRSIAMAEVAWTAAELKNWDDFYVRLNDNLKYLDFDGIVHGAPSYSVRINVTPDDATGKVLLDLFSEVEGNVYYTMDGSEPTKESKVFDGTQEINSDCTVKAVMFRPDGSRGMIASESINFHKALGRKVAYDIAYSDKHSGGGDFAMTNGLMGKWQGFEKRNVDMVLDLGSATEINSISTSWLYDLKDWVHKPSKVTYEISTDGKTFEQVFLWDYVHPAGTYGKGVETLEKKFDAPTQVRYIRLRADNVMVNPKWHSSAGAATWVFVDEIVVR